MINCGFCRDELAQIVHDILFNGMSTFMGYLNSKSSLKKNSIDIIKSKAGWIKEFVPPLRVLE